ncbi:MAG: hypothetical protein V1787_06115 [Candidatus Micrarchaeota archaeon]
MPTGTPPTRGNLEKIQNRSISSLREEHGAIFGREGTYGQAVHSKIRSGDPKAIEEMVKRRWADSVASHLHRIHQEGVNLVGERRAIPPTDRRTEQRRAGRMYPDRRNGDRRTGESVELLARNLVKEHSLIGPVVNGKYWIIAPMKYWIESPVKNNSWKSFVTRFRKASRIAFTMGTRYLGERRTGKTQ